MTSGGGSGTYALSYQNNRNADQSGFQIQFVSLQGTPITSVTVPSGGQASFAVQVTANGNVITNDPTEFQWFVTATPTIATQSMRIPFYYRAVSPTLQNVVAPVQGPILADNPGAGGACGLDTNSSYTVQWSYTIPNGGPAPAGFRIQEATRSTNIFFDDASEALIASGNSKWTGGNDWSSQIDPNSTNLEYYVPDTAMQNSSLVMNTNLPVPPGGASLSFFTSQDLEETFDFAFVEVSTDNGNSFTTVGSYTYDFIGTRHIDLSQFAGQSIKVRFRITSDTLNGQQDPAPTGWYIGNIAIASDDFHTIAEPGPTSTSMLVFGRSNGSYIYRIAGLFDIGPGTAPGPYSGSQCVTETIGVPLIVSIATLTNKHVLLDCRGQALVSHRIQGAADLHIWSNLGTNTASSNGTFQFEDTNTAGVGHRFYRLVTP